jgi:hypothetical protein
MQLASTLQFRARGRNGPTTKARRQRCLISLPGTSEFVVLSRPIAVHRRDDYSFA